MGNEISYLPIWQRYLRQLREAGVSDADAGELLFAMMEYHFDEKQPELTGAGRWIWPFIKPDLDQAKAKYAASVANGAKSKKWKPGPDPAEPGGDPEASRHSPGTGPEGPMSKTESMSKTAFSSDEEKERAPAGKTQKAFGEFGWVRLTEDEYSRLLRDLGEAEVNRCIAYVDESAQATGNKNRWKDWNLVVRKCSRQGWGLDAGSRYGRTPAKTGPRTFDDDEVRAIRRMMEETI